MKQELMYRMPGFQNQKWSRINEVFALLVPVMNKIHKINYSQRFWVSLIGEHVIACVNRENLMSDLILNQKPHLLPINAWTFPPPSRVRKMLLIYYAKAFSKSTSIERVLDIVKSNCNICLGPRGKELERQGLGVFCPDHIPFLYVPNKKARSIALSLADKEKNIFFSNVIRQLPTFYVEYFQSSLKRIRINDPENKTFHVEHSSPFMNILMAVYMEKGSKVFRYQGGGFVGETQSSLMGSKYTIVDKFRTYGWKIHEKDEPFFAIRLEEFKKEFQKQQKSAASDLLISYNNIDRSEVKDYYKKKSEYLFDKIDKTKYKNIILRPRGYSRRVNNGTILDFIKRPDFVTVDKGMKMMYEIMRHSKIVIHWSHPSTNFLECIFVDHPVLAIYSEDQPVFYEPTEIVKPYYEFFLEHKVLHPSVESLVAHLNQTNIEEWWKNVVQLKKYQEFKNTFARNKEAYLQQVGNQHNSNPNV